MQESTTWIEMASARCGLSLALAVCVSLASGCGASEPNRGAAAMPAAPSTAAPAPASGAMNPGTSALGGAAAPSPQSPAMMVPSQPMTPGPATPTQPAQPISMLPAAGANAGGGGSSGTAAGGAAGMAPASGCDRPCLIAVLSTYLDGLAKKDPAMVMFTDDVRFTENGMQREIGQGLWQMASGVRAGTRLDFADPVGGQVGSQLVLELGSAATAFNVRLKVVEGRISEVETVAPGATSAVPTNLMGLVPDPIFLQPIDPAKRSSREDLLKAAQAYERLLETGSYRMSGAMFHPDMVRLENGAETADAASLIAREGGMARGDVPSRYPIIDEEYGMVFAVYEFGSILVPNELFKIMDGQIRLLNIVINGQAMDGWD